MRTSASRITSQPCCHAYSENTSWYTAPYATITQSSGFGKSRILKRLAETPTIEHGGVQFDVKVLYICARTIERSSGYPCATPALREWLFPDGCSKAQIITALKKAFTYSVENSDAREKWLKLFEVEDNYSVDGDVKRELDKVKLRASTSNQPVEKRKKPTVIPVLVVAIDEARSLLEIKGNNGDNAFKILRRALEEVNGTAMLKKVNGIVFAVLVDTNSRVHEFVPALSADPSSRDRAGGSTALFPPFVLTETLDILVDRWVTGRDRVLTAGAGRDETKEVVWAALVSMGRHLWSSMDDTDSQLSRRKKELTSLAASKLLIGLPMDLSASYTDTTLHGVASLFCRGGFRPYVTNPIASRLVADFMSVLHYVTFKNDGQISGYVSEPILTFGASCMWYQLEKDNTPSALESHILPQFETMMLNGMIDTDIGELVARIFLLLAMDGVAMGNVVKQEFVFSGDFCDVAEFVGKLVGDNPKLREEQANVNHPNSRFDHPHVSLYRQPKISSTFSRSRSWSHS